MTPETLARLHARAMTDQSPWSAPTFEGLLQFPGAILVGGEAGFALGRVVADEAELLTLVVLPEARRRGIGRACLAGFEDMARDRGAVRAFLEVAEGNSAARALYAHAGYAAVGHRAKYYRAPDGTLRDAIVMEKALIAA